MEIPLRYCHVQSTGLQLVAHRANMAICIFLFHRTRPRLMEENPTVRAAYFPHNKVSSYVLTKQWLRLRKSFLWLLRSSKIFCQLAMFCNFWQESFFHKFAIRGLVTVVSSVSIHRDIEMQSKNKQSHRRIQRVMNKVTTRGSNVS